MLILSVFLAFVASAAACTGSNGQPGVCAARDSCLANGQSVSTTDDCSDGQVCCTAPRTCQSGVCVGKDFCASHSGVASGPCGADDVVCCDSLSPTKFTPQESATCTLFGRTGTCASSCRSENSAIDVQCPEGSPLCCVDGTEPLPASQVSGKACYFPGMNTAGTCATWCADPNRFYQHANCINTGCCMVQSPRPAAPAPRPRNTLCTFTGGLSGQCAHRCAAGQTRHAHPKCTENGAGEACCFTRAAPAVQTCSLTDGRRGHCSTACSAPLIAVRNSHCPTTTCCVQPFGSSSGGGGTTGGNGGTTGGNGGTTGGNGGTTGVRDKTADAKGCMMTGAGQRGCSQCFLPSVHAQYLGAQSTTTYTLTAYVQSRFNTQAMQQQIRAAVTAVNNMFGGRSGVRFAAPVFRVLPDNLDPDKTRITPTMDWMRDCAKRYRSGDAAVRQCPGLYRAESEFREFLRSNHKNQAVAVFAELDLYGDNAKQGGYVDGLAYSMPWDGYWYNGVQNYVNLLNGLDSTSFIHEFGHSLGLMHTFANYDQQATDCAAQKWLMDGIDDTTVTPQISGCRQKLKPPCESKERFLDTNNVMSYGYCNDGRYPRITAGQLARIACCKDKHGRGWLQSGTRSAFTRHTVRPVTSDGFDEANEIFELGEKFVAQVGDSMSIDLPEQLDSIAVYLYKTNGVLSMPESELEAEIFRILPAVTSTSRKIDLKFLNYANGDPIDRGSYTVVLVSKAPTQRTYVTSVFTIDTLPCEGTKERPIGFMRKELECANRGGSPHGPITDGLVCCLPGLVQYDLKTPPTHSSNGQFVHMVSSADNKVMTVMWPGFTWFWGAPVTIRTVEAPADQQDVEVLFAVAGQADLSGSKVQKLSLPGQVDGEVTFTPDAFTPNSYDLSTVGGASTNSFSIAALPCRTSGDEAGYCLPTSAIETLLGTTDSELICSSGDTAGCGGLAVGDVKFACCAGAHAASSFQNAANYRDGTDTSGAVAQQASFVVIAIIAALSFQ